MAKVHFFTEYSKLPIQTAADSFGPDSNNPTTIYNISSRFQLTSISKAFACQTGKFIVQESTMDSSLVNIILKPNEIAISTKVEYYVYRGILKSSLISGTHLTPYSSGINNFLTRVYDQNPSETGANLIGFDNMIPGNVKIEVVFNTPGLFNLYTYPVKQGEWFGDFGFEYNTSPSTTESYKIGIEIIMEADRLNIDIEYLRRATYEVNTSSTPTIALSAKREEVTAYIDPAAYFGLFYTLGIGVGIATAPKRNQPLYDDILSKFYTKNKVYLDIRNEKAYSYNFYNNYFDTNGDNLKLGYRGVNPAVQKYSTDPTNQTWPIVTIDANQSNANTNIVRFNIRIDDNLSPIIYIPNPSIRTDNNESFFLEENDIKNGSSNWSNELKFKFPNATLSGTTEKANVAHYIRIYYFRKQIDDYTNIPVTVPHFDKYYNGAFCPINFSTFTHKSSFPHFVREMLNDTDGTGNFELISEAGVFKDGSRVLFYSEKIRSLKNSGKDYLPTYEKKLEITNSDYNLGLNGRLDTIVYDYQVNASTNVRISGINSYSDSSDTLQKKEDLLLLGITNAELTAIQAATGLSNNHDKFIFLEADTSNPLSYSGGNRFNRFTVKLQGINPTNGLAHKITPVVGTGPLFLYSRDMQFFSSQSFGATETVTAGQNRLEYHTYLDGVIKIKDNIDLSLIRKKVIIDRDSLADDNQIPNDNSSVSKMHYFYHDADNLLNGTLVCSFDIVMANKMVRVDTNVLNFPQNFPNFVQTIDYNNPNPVTGVSADESYENVQGDIITTGDNRVRKYDNQGKKVFMVKVEPALLNASLLIDNNPPENKFTFEETFRYFAFPAITAAVIGSLINIIDEVISTGFSYGDASSYPSYYHVNGLAMDTMYNTNNQDLLFITQLNNFGFQTFRIGYHKTILSNLLTNAGLNNLVLVDGPKDNPNDQTLHDSHLHCENFVINNAVKLNPQQ